jgi:pyruvate kinase
VTFPVIVATLGTTTDDPAVLKAMIDAGMGLARVNTAYASPEELRRRIAGARAAGVPVLLDLKGPQLRVDCTTEKTDATGHTVSVPCRYPIARGDVICVGFGEAGRRWPVRFNHDFAASVEPGDEVTFDNGTIRTRVVDPAARSLSAPEAAVLLEVLDAGSGKMSPQMGANVPGKRLDVPRLSARDRELLALGVELGVAWYALSFVREPEDILALHTALAGAPGGLVAKIEERGGIGALEAIVAAVRGAGREAAVMIARGDLFVELPAVELPHVQADLLRRCRALDVPAIVATGLLLSMQRSPRPARSEVCDVAAAAAAGAKSFMLSDETSNSEHPVAAVATLAELIDHYVPTEVKR